MAVENRILLWYFFGYLPCFMPSRNTIKQYAEQSYYHIYNRGVEKRKIFLDDQDFSVFLSFLRDYLSPINKKKLLNDLANPKLNQFDRNRILKLLRLNNFASEITLLAFSLMPNHFHFFIKQSNSRIINKFIQSLCTRYSIYFNNKYDRVGSLYQGVYKAKMVTTEAQFLHLSRYIHKQALDLSKNPYQEKFPTSYEDYTGTRKTPWIHPEEILSFFSKTNPNLSYSSFINEKEDPQFLEFILDDEE